MALSTFPVSALRDTAPGQDIQLLTTAIPDPRGFGRAVLIECTAAATITFVFPGGGTASAVTFPTGLFEFNWSVTQFTLVSGTARVWNIY